MHVGAAFVSHVARRNLVRTGMLESIAQGPGPECAGC